MRVAMVFVQLLKKGEQKDLFQFFIQGASLSEAGEYSAGADD